MDTIDHGPPSPALLLSPEDRESPPGNKRGSTTQELSVGAGGGDLVSASHVTASGRSLTGSALDRWPRKLRRVTAATEHQSLGCDLLGLPLGGPAGGEEQGSPNLSFPGTQQEKGREQNSLIANRRRNQTPRPVPQGRPLLTFFRDTL